MEKCKIAKRLNYYLNDEVSPAERVIIENHLESCEICREVLADLQIEDGLITDFLSNYQAEELDSDLRDKVLSISKKVHQRSKFTQSMIKLSVAASVIVSFSLGIIISQNMISEDVEILYSQNSLVDFDYIYGNGE